MSSIGIRFEPGEWYTDTQVRIAGLDGDVQKKARRDGKLRYKPLSKKESLYLGEWLNEWLDSLPTVEPQAAGGAK